MERELRHRIELNQIPMSFAPDLVTEIGAILYSLNIETQMVVSNLILYPAGYRIKKTGGATACELKIVKQRAYVYVHPVFLKNVRSVEIPQRNWTPMQHKEFLNSACLTDDSEIVVRYEIAESRRSRISVVTCSRYPSKLWVDYEFEYSPKLKKHFNAISNCVQADVLFCAMFQSAKNKVTISRAITNFKSKYSFAKTVFQMPNSSRLELWLGNFVADRQSYNRPTSLSYAKMIQMDRTSVLFSHKIDGVNGLVFFSKVGLVTDSQVILWKVNGFFDDMFEFTLGYESNEPFCFDCVKSLCFQGEKTSRHIVLYNLVTVGGIKFTPSRQFFLQFFNSILPNYLSKMTLRASSKSNFVLRAQHFFRKLITVADSTFPTDGFIVTTFKPSLVQYRVKLQDTFELQYSGHLLFADHEGNFYQIDKMAINFTLSEGAIYECVVRNNFVCRLIRQRLDRTFPNTKNQINGGKLG